MSITAVGTLCVPGALLHYQVRGSTGPLLLILPSGGGDADSCDALAGHLADHHTVVSYDRRRAAAMRTFMAHADARLADREPDLPWTRPTARPVANADFFLAHDAGAVRRYLLEPAALEAAATRILPAAGSTSRHVWTHRCAAELARRAAGRLAGCTATGLADLQ